MRTYNISIKNTPIEIRISEALVDSATENSISFDLGTGDIKEAIKIDFIDFKTFYSQKASKQWLTVKRLLKRQVDGQEVTEVTASYQASFDIDPFELVTVDLGQGDIQLPRFVLFEYLSQIGGLRLCEHFINGLTKYAVKQATLLDRTNPIFMNRDSVTEYPLVEPFDNSYALIQPLVAYLESTVLETASGANDGTVTIAVTESNGSTAQWKLDIDAEWQAVVANSITVNGAGSMVKTVLVKDDTAQYTFEVIAPAATI